MAQDKTENGELWILKTKVPMHSNKDNFLIVLSQLDIHVKKRTLIPIFTPYIQKYIPNELQT